MPVAGAGKSDVVTREGAVPDVGHHDDIIARAALIPAMESDDADRFIGTRDAYLENATQCSGSLLVGEFFGDGGGGVFLG